MEKPETNANKNPLRMSLEDAEEETGFNLVLHAKNLPNILKKMKEYQRYNCTPTMPPEELQAANRPDTPPKRINTPAKEEQKQRRNTQTALKAPGRTMRNVNSQNL